MMINELVHQIQHQAKANLSLKINLKVGALLIKDGVVSFDHSAAEIVTKFENDS